VFAAIADCWPQAPLYTTVYSEDGTEHRFAERDVRPSGLQRLGVGQSHFRALYPFYPGAVGRLPVGGHDLVISSSSAFAHGIRASEDAVHICACHTPFRYLWYEHDFALSAAPAPMRPLLKALLARNRRWDLAAASRVDHYIALSHQAQKRIEDIYGREARVVLPGADIDRFAPGVAEDFFLMVGEVVPHKRHERAIQAAAIAGVPITVVGDGPDLARLRELYGSSANFLGHVSDDELAHIYPRARALVIPNAEEFGLVSVEAQASGRPVIAIDGPGGRDSIIDGETGVLVSEATAEGFAEAMRDVDFDRFDPVAIRRNAERFSIQAFRDRFLAEVERLTASEPERSLASSRDVA
jgi:glycosyltransferase involved in cell wall biosynthesis